MILVAPDKFKGTMTAREAAEAIERGLRRGGVTDTVLLRPMADGGEGTPGILYAEALAGEPGVYALPDGDSALVMSCELCGQGLKDIPPAGRSSRALGEAVRRLGDRFDTVYIGIGGTLTVDAGLGFLQGLGFTVRDASGTAFTEAVTPRLIASRGLSEAVAPEESFPEIIGLCDVACPLVPKRCCPVSAIDFAAQKGFVGEELQAMARKVISEADDCLLSPTAAFGGAGGGLGFAVGLVPGARCILGADYVLQLMDYCFEEATLVITGEGCIDSQTGAGKVVDAVWRAARKRNVPFLAVGGVVKGESPYPRVLACQGSDKPLPSPQKASEILEKSVEKWARANLAN